MQIEDLLRMAREAQASDLLLVPGRSPCVYIYGRLTTLGGEPLSAGPLQEMLGSFMPPALRERLMQTGDADFACGLENVGRMRVNVHRQRGTWAASIRFINTHAPSFEELSLPPQLGELARLTRGLVLVTGSTGSGKSTTLATMIEYMNEHMERHIITLEDPIEFLFKHRRCVIEQREIGDDSPSFDQALRHVLRQKPDVILVGEMRDRETISTALTAAETGHLVLGTLHTSSAAQTVDRVIDVFEPGHQSQIRVQLAGSLRAVVCQTLLPRRNQDGLVPALEILISTQAIRRAIRESETHLLAGMIETGSKFGMCSMDHSLAHLAASGQVTLEAASVRASDPERFEKIMSPYTRQRPAVTSTAPAEQARVIEASVPQEAASTGGSKPWL